MSGKGQAHTERDAQLETLLNLPITLVHDRVDRDMFANKQQLENCVRIAESLNLVKLGYLDGKPFQNQSELVGLMLALRGTRPQTHYPQEAGMPGEKLKTVKMGNVINHAVIEAVAQLKKHEEKSVAFLSELYTRIPDVVRLLGSQHKTGKVAEAYKKAEKAVHADRIVSTSPSILDEHDLNIEEQRDQFYLVMRISDFKAQNALRYHDAYLEKDVAAGTIASMYSVMRQRRTLEIYIQTVCKYVSGIDDILLAQSKSPYVSRFGRYVAVIKSLADEMSDKPNFSITAWKHEVSLSNGAKSWAAKLEDYKNDCMLTIFEQAVKHAKSAELTALVNSKNEKLLVLADKIISRVNPKDHAMEKALHSLHATKKTTRKPK